MPKTPVQCPSCSKIISRKEDLPRHLETHAQNKEDLMHPCTHPGCKFKTLQKSNLQTHQRIHTQIRSQTCPEHGCEFSSTDPGSLTRHRKNIHNYEPKPRRNPAGRVARRAAAAPYPSTRLATPEASFSVVTAHPLSQSAQGPPNSRPDQLPIPASIHFQPSTVPVDLSTFHAQFDSFSNENCQAPTHDIVEY
ncbi:hypothetical protein DEU56DRAFT_760201 [Suillus clintonianus]|uniref:uncharacterized protein n=1 Tax=Suillus clintonianus TaxID=1904413 RepID=UPI001B870C89|nr:uncharacterized protein DEU56DRAFT_760201 [Suillus clintonianus]KAG2122923.1 hypothetical protein DEU56DRAFT_760201 [Suillus clintonianus]